MKLAPWHQLETSQQVDWNRFFSQSMVNHNPQENPRTYTGWWYTYPSEKYLSVGIIIPHIWGKNHVPNHQTRVNIDNIPNSSEIVVINPVNN